MFVLVFLVVYVFSNNDKGENENKEYRITCMIMNDHMKHIRYYNLGWPGNVHNNKVY